MNWTGRRSSRVLMTLAMLAQVAVAQKPLQMQQNPASTQTVGEKAPRPRPDGLNPLGGTDRSLTDSLPFIFQPFFANKTLQDRRNFERVNAIFGLSFLRDSRFVGVGIEQRSHGYGYFLELDTIPVAKRLSVFGRYDQLRPTTLVAANTIRGGTLGVIYGPIRYARVSLEYQRLDGLQSVNRYRIGLQFNF